MATSFAYRFFVFLLGSFSLPLSGGESIAMLITYCLIWCRQGPCLPKLLEMETSMVWPILGCRKIMIRFRWLGWLHVLLLVCVTWRDEGHGWVRSSIYVCWQYHYIVMKLKLHLLKLNYTTKNKCSAFHFLEVNQKLHQFLCTVNETRQGSQDFDNRHAWFSVLMDLTFPRTQVLNALEGNTPLDELNDGLQPIHRSVHTSSPGSAELDLSYDTMQYKEDLIKFRKMALQSMDVTTSECSGPTSEFGALPSGSSGEGVQKPR